VKHLRTAATAVIALALAGCGGPLILQFQGAEKLNLNDKEPPESVPVEVRVFLLKDKASFTNAPFEQLWGQKYKAVLGADVVGEPRTITIFASKKSPLDLGTVPTDVRFIGVMAMYQKKGEGTVKRHEAVSKEDADDVIFELIEYRLEVKK